MDTSSAAANTNAAPKFKKRNNKKKQGNNAAAAAAAVDAGSRSPKRKSHPVNHHNNPRHFSTNGANPPPGPTTTSAASANSEHLEKKKAPRKRRNNKKSKGAEAGQETAMMDCNNDDEEAKVVENEDMQTAAETTPSHHHRHQFSDFPFSAHKGISDASRRALAQVLKYEMMTKVQSATLDTLLKGTDVLAKAKTGTGKTTAFLLPIVERIAAAKQDPQYRKTNGISAVILSPTRELTNQIAEEAKELTTFHGITIVSLIGGTNINTDKKRLNGNVDIIVATPGRFQDHLQSNNSNITQRLEGLKCLCLDEADRLLDMGFRKELARIIAYMPKERQTLLFSATLPDSLQEITKVALKPNYEYIDTVGEDESNTNVQVIQEYLVCPLENQIVTLEAILREHQVESENASAAYKIIVFFNTARTAGFMSDIFRTANFPILEMHSRKSQSYRTKCAKEFTDKNNVMMFSSDVSARGVDYPGVTLIVQIGLTEREQYIHRLGRTARAGRSGRGIILLGEFESFFLKKELKDLEIEKSELSLPHNVTTPMMALLDTLEKDKALVKSAEMAYQSFLGYYNSNLRRMGMDKVKLVQMANEYSSSIGLSYVPALLAKTVGKMGLKGVPGLVLTKPAAKSSNNDSRKSNYNRR